MKQQGILEEARGELREKRSLNAGLPIDFSAAKAVMYAAFEVSARDAAAKVESTPLVVWAAKVGER